jgi:PucR family transcriptional regulator, purine catabolism regulatory protein
MLVTAGSTVSPEIVRMEISRRLHELRTSSLGVMRQQSAAFLVGTEEDQVLLNLARELVRDGTVGRIGIGRSATGRTLGRSVVEARTALAALAGDVVSYRELGPLELLLALPDPTLVAFVERVLSSVVRQSALITSLNTLFATGWAWSEAARQLGVHRHTLPNRMNRVRLLANSDPDKPEERMEGRLSGR